MAHARSRVREVLPSAWGGGEGGWKWKECKCGDGGRRAVCANDN